MGKTIKYGDYEIQTSTLGIYKKPHLLIYVKPAEAHVLGSFLGEESAEEFINYLYEMLKAVKRETD